MALSPPLETEAADDGEPLVFTASALVRHDPSCADVTLAGELCASTAPDLLALLDGLISDGITAITLDVSTLRICTSHGVDVIDACRSRLAEGGGSLSIENAGGAVSEVLDVVGMPLGEQHR